MIFYIMKSEIKENTKNQSDKNKSWRDSMKNYDAERRKNDVFEIYLFVKIAILIMKW